MNPADRWNPGWQQFMMNHQRAQAGGNRHVQPVQPVINQFGGGARNVVERNGQQRRNNIPAQNANRRNQNRQINHNNNNQNGARRDNRAQTRETLTRDDLERIEAVTRKNFQTRTALEYDNRENQCWMNIHNKIEKESRRFTSSTKFVSVHNGGDIFIPTEDNICSNLRIENQTEVIMKTRELLLNFGATEHEITDALTNLEIHLKTNSFELSFIQDLSNELINNAGKLAKEMDELDDILHRIERIRLHKT